MLVTFSVLLVLSLLVACAPSRDVPVSVVGAEASKKSEDQDPVAPGGRESMVVAADTTIIVPPASSLEPDDSLANPIRELAEVVDEVMGSSPRTSEGPIPRPTSLYGGLCLGIGEEARADLDPYPSIGIRFGALPRSGRVGIEIRGLVAFPSIPDGALASATTDVTELDMDALVRLYATPSHTLVGLYGAVGGRVGVLDWSYEHAVTYDDGFGTVTTIDEDGVWFVSPLLGGGVSLFRSSRLHVGIELTAGYKIHKWNTREGFENDVIDDGLFVDALLDVSVILPR